jgi:T5SS/PEP-CTERM-associated repeat protein
MSLLRFHRRFAQGVAVLGILAGGVSGLVAEDNQVVLIDGISTNFGFPYFVGETGTNNFLIITNGGSAVSGGTFIGGAETAHRNGVVIAGPNSRLEGALRVGDYGGQNLLVVTDGGAVHSNEGTLGSHLESKNNTAVITGSNSVWTVDARLQVGWSGSSNRLVVRDGATVNGFGAIGDDGVSSNNVVEITGPGTLWNGGIFVTFGTGNRLSVSDGGKVVGGNVSMAIADFSSNNVLTVMGPGSELDLRDGFLKVGELGSSNSVLIADGATVTSRSGYLGGPTPDIRGHFNTVEVTGSNSVWNVREDLYASYSGSNNTLRVAGGGSVNAGALTVGGFSNNVVQVDTEGTLIVTNAMQTLNGALALDGGTARLGQLWCNNLSGGELLLNAGSLVVTQASQIDYGANPLVIGARAGKTATFALLPGSHSINAAGGVLIGGETGCRGELLLSGSNSILRGPVYAGENDRSRGSGLLSVTGSAVVEANVIVSGTNGSGTVLNDGGVFQFTLANPALTNLSPESIVLTNGTISFRNVVQADPRTFSRTTPNLVLKGDNAFRLNNSTSVVLNTFTLAKADTNGYFRLELMGGGTAWNSTNLVIGPAGEMFISNTVARIGVPRGSLVVTNGSRVFNFVDAASLNRPVSNLAFVVSGPGTIWTNRSSFAIGYDGGSNLLSISSGAALYSQDGYIGFSGSSSNNVVRLTGAGSIWSNRTEVTVGNSGSRSRLFIEDGAEVRTLRLTVGASGATSNEVWVSRGSLVASDFSGSGAVQIRLGVLNVQDGVVVTDRLTPGPSSFGRVNFSSGVMDLGVASINNGLPFVAGDGTNSAQLSLKVSVHSFPQGLTVSSNAWLAAGGSIIGNVTNRGGISMSRAGSLRIEGNLRHDAGAVLVIALGGVMPGIQYSFLNVTNTVALAGLLQIQLTNNFRPYWSDTFDPVRFRFRSGEFANATNGQRLDIANGPGSFRVWYGATSLALTDFRLDGNGDGIDDAWATNFFGSNFLPDGTGPNDRFGDKDGDGLNNFQEYVAGTNPLDPLRALKIVSVGLNELRDAVIDFQCASNRVYGVQYSPDMNSWNAVASPLFTNPMAGTCRWTDDGTQTGGRPTPGWARFYRVSVN